MLPPATFATASPRCRRTKPALATFPGSFPSRSNLNGHSFEKQFLTALTAITGDFAEEVKQSSEILATRHAEGQLALSLSDQSFEKLRKLMFGRLGLVRKS